MPVSVLYQTQVTLYFQATPIISTHSGDLIWVREEGLASIVAVAMVDLPSAQLATEEFLSLLEDESNPVLLGIKRLTLQVTLAKDMIQDIARKGVASIFKRAGTEELLRNDFNTKKMIIAVTSHCKVSIIDE